MSKAVIFFYLGLAMQLIGLTSVGLCFIAGISQGDYSKVELAQFIGGSAIFYLGALLKSRA